MHHGLAQVQLVRVWPTNDGAVPYGDHGIGREIIRELGNKLPEPLGDMGVRPDYVFVVSTEPRADDYESCRRVPVHDADGVGGFEQVGVLYRV